jgi:hypothetical protein
MTLAYVLSALLTTAAPGVIAWLIIRNIAWFGRLENVGRAIAAFIVSAVLCVLAYALQVAMGYTPAPNPPDWRGWLEALTPVIAWAYTVSQGAYWAGRAAQTRGP